MNVDFDGIRKNIATAYNELVDTFNEKVQLQSSSNNVELDMWEIEESVNELRAGIATLLCIYEENLGIKSLADFRLKILETDYND